VEVEEILTVKGYVKVDKLEYQSEDELARNLYQETKFRIAITEDHINFMKQKGRKKGLNYLKFLQ
jgi:predicted DNA binding CopG/RHH family protein